MIFFLGTHQVCWLARLHHIPLFVSRRRLVDCKRLPRATTDWAMDSGGFTELSAAGHWSLTPRQYADEVRHYHDEIGKLLWAAPQDWMCEPAILRKTGLSVTQHQQRTLDNYHALQDADPDLPWVPVLQGWEPADYLRHADQYHRAGHPLAQLPLVAVGTVCRRQHTATAERILRDLTARHLRLHAFGFKITGLARAADSLASADSLAWSYAARRRPPLPGCPHHSCANCMAWALQWRDRVLQTVQNQSRTHQLSLDFLPGTERP